MLVDTSVWVDHFRRGSPRLVLALEDGEVECHPSIIGELACGNLRRRREILDLLADLPQLAEAGHDEVMTLIERQRLMGRGLGWVDAHLLASTLIGGTTLWTLDRRLADQATRLRVRFV